MEKKEKALAKYEIFGSDLRGTDAVEKEIVAVILEKETPENIQKLARELDKVWSKEDENVSRLKLSFSKFEEKLELRKAEISRVYALDKEKRKAPSKLKEIVKT